MSNSKTFRLFISSTFSDFKREREILQSEVFPKIKAYAAEQGYSFQPIDLRWGVSNEAQLDQKTLELCLDEVKACKTYRHPNFLVMLGDRYGWVPLPYAIEVTEFETLLSLISDQDKQNVEKWYKKDLNQLPASYLLKERVKAFEVFNVWEKEETKLRDILQAAVNNSRLGDEHKRKYFTSATEAEVEEGIITYIKPTAFQKKLVAENNNLREIDSKNIFGFFRNVEIHSRIEDMYVGHDYEKAQAFKNRVINVLPDKNSLRSSTIQIDKNRLDECYLSDFQERISNFLKSQLDAQKQKEELESFTPLQIELAEQKNFVEIKRQNFIGHERLRGLVASYVSSTNQEPLLIYGKSGSGKSSLMAKIVSQTQEVKLKQVLYRFVGATPYSACSKNILISLFTELGLVIDESDQKMANEDFIQFSKRICYKLSTIKNDVIIIIDAVDQLINEDDFLWLPSKLPVNVKIIISALKDKVHPKDSLSYHLLRTKISSENQMEMPEFESADTLLFELLAKENRTLQQEQIKYFEKQFQSAKTPLYVYVAAQELKSWKSTCIIGKQSYVEVGIVQNLKVTQQGIINEFITNLSSLYHHDANFIVRVFGYLLASRDGLSERQLLELIATDGSFIESIAQENYHQNINKELPLIHWSRLHAQLKPFLSHKNQDSEELICFSHREFENAAKNIISTKKEHENLIVAIQVLIQNNSDKCAISFSWEKLYVKSTMYHYSLYSDEKSLSDFMMFLSSRPNKSAHDMIAHHNVSFNRSDTIAYCKCDFYFTKYFYDLDKENHFNRNFHQMSLTRMSLALKNNFEQEESLAFDLKAFELANEAHKKYNINPKDSLNSKSNLAATYLRQHQFDKAEAILTEILPVVENFFDSDVAKKFIVSPDMSTAILSNDWTDLYLTVLNNLGECHSQKLAHEESRIFLNKAISITELLIDSAPKHYMEKHVITLTNLAQTYLHGGNNGVFHEAVNILKEVSAKLDKYYCNESNYLVTQFVDNGLALSYVQEMNGDYNDALANLRKVQPVLAKLMLKDESKFWDLKNFDYLVTSAKVNFHLNYPEALNLLTQVTNLVTAKNLIGDKVVRQLDELNELFNDGDAKYSDWYYLAAYVAKQRKAMEIEPQDFYTALGFIKLSPLAEKILSQIFDLTILPILKNSNIFIEYGQTISDIGINVNSKEFIEKLKTMIKGDTIGTLRQA